MCLRTKEKSIEGVKNPRKYSQKLLSNVPYLYEKLLELFCTMNFIYGEVYLRSWSDTVLNFWSIFAMQLKMILWFCNIIIFCCCSKIQLTEASISIRNASARVKHLVHGDMSRNTATNSVYNKCGMTFVMKRNKNLGSFMKWADFTLCVIIDVVIVWGEPPIALGTKTKLRGITA